MKIKKYNMAGEEVGDLELDDSVFNTEYKELLVYEAIKAENNNLRKGNHFTKSRGEVLFTNAKPWRQKGTGRARSGAANSPIWRGGGVVFGPKPGNTKVRLPRKVKQAALRSILTKKIKDSNVFVIDSLQLEKFSTRAIIDVIKNLKLADRKSLTIVLGNEDKLVKKSISNIANVKQINALRLSARGLLYNHALLMTEEAVNKINEIFGVAK